MSLRAQPLRAALYGAAFCFCAGASHADRAAITSQNADMLSVIDLDSQQILRSTPLPGKPAALAVDAARGRIYAVAVESKRLHVFDLDGKALADWPLPGAPFALALRPETGTLLISDQTGYLREIDPQSGAERQQWQTGAMPSGVAVAGDRIVVANRDADSLTLISGRTQQNLTVGHHPFGVTLYGNRAYVANVLSDTVSVVDLETPAVIAEFATAERPYAIAFAAGKGFVTNQYDSSLTVFDPDSLKVIGTIACDDYPEGIAASPDGAEIIIANWFSDSVQIIDADTLTVKNTIDVPEGPRAFGSFTWH